MKTNKLLIYGLIIILVSTIILANTIINSDDSWIDIGDKEVKEVCKPVYETWIEEIPHYKDCTTDNCKVDIFPNGTKCIESVYTCLDYIEKIEHKNEQVDCIKIGEVNVSGKIYEGNDAYCKMEGNKMCCYSNKEGGKYATTWRTDGSVDKECKDIITDKIDLISSDGKRFIK